MDIEVPLSNLRKKSDLAFYYSFTYLKRVNHLQIGLEVLKTLAFIILIPVNLTSLDYPFGNLIVAFIINLIASCIGILYYCMISILVFNSVMSYLTIADQAKHTVQNEQIVDFSCIQNCVSSTIYLGETEVRQQDLDQEGKKLHQNITKSMIKAIIKGRFIWSKNTQSLYCMISFVSMIFTIYVLATNSLVPIDVCILSIYVVLVGLTQLPLIIISVAVILSPLICLGMAIYCCFCAKAKDGNNFIDLEMKQAKQEEIFNAGGDCAICYMSMVPKDKIYILPCSEKHVFHCDCLRHWAKVKNTCPICRAEIPMSNAERASQAENQSVQPNSTA